MYSFRLIALDHPPRHGHFVTSASCTTPLGAYWPHPSVSELKSSRERTVFCFYAACSLSGFLLDMSCAACAIATLLPFTSQV